MGNPQVPRHEEFEQARVQDRVNNQKHRQEKLLFRQRRQRAQEKKLEVILRKKPWTGKITITGSSEYMTHKAKYPFGLLGAGRGGVARSLFA